jgi:hypothetical protein
MQVRFVWNTDSPTVKWKELKSSPQNSVFGHFTSCITVLLSITHDHYPNSTFTAAVVSPYTTETLRNYILDLLTKTHYQKLFKELSNFLLCENPCYHSIHYVVLDLITQIILDDEQKSRNSSLYTSLQPPVTFLPC